MAAVRLEENENEGHNIRRWCSWTKEKDFKTLSLPNANLTKSSKLPNPEPKGVTTQMKALDEY